LVERHLLLKNNVTLNHAHVRIHGQDFSAVQRSKMAITPVSRTKRGTALAGRFSQKLDVWDGQMYFLEHLTLCPDV
jgi:hypothetical protein